MSTTNTPAGDTALLTRDRADANSFADARFRMVNDQVRPVEVSDPRIIAAMRVIPREDCLSGSVRQFAYADRSLPLGNGRILMQSMIAARLLQAARIVAGENILVAAAGPGYLAALADWLGAKVTALESSPELLKTGQAFTTHAAPGVTWKEGPLAEGNTERGPYSLILFDGAISEIPAFCSAQLAEGGRIAGILRRDNGTASVFLAERNGSTENGTGWGIRRQFDVDVPCIPEFAPKAGFSF
ncbi:protein-L-isoaspartate O-methyltransferase [Acetobacter sp. AN02]|uniref:protein-L-isoaspartate O-methyltransferase family protein n=1 Tax=Acetobacter sp. AN02 TaxID=2894186 RepID=UPI002434223E|nr:protein-L-isoaspartate O-methyltransferase [Acetobacter sp. AN02]MDG6093863.1 protein-L-isoaspartate O-methyltransferase [Acetobacter sp. AN02]